MIAQDPPPLSGWRAAAVLGAIAGLVFMATRLSQGPQTRKPLEGMAEDFTLPSLSGKKVSLSDFKGKVVLIDFWATWCSPCREEVPDLIALQQKYKDRGFTVLGVSLDTGSRNQVAAFVSGNKIPYPVLLAGGDAPAGYLVPGLPSAVLVDRTGRLARSYLGGRTLEEFSADVDTVIGP